MPPVATRLALVVLRQRSQFAIDLGPTVTPDQLTEALQIGAAADALPGLGPQRFGPLTRRTRPPAPPGTGPTVPDPALPDTFTVRNQAAPAQVAFSICRIFRWD